MVDSYFVALNAFSSLDNFPSNTSVTFDVAGGVLSPNFAVSDFLGAPNVTYNESSRLSCAFGIFQGINQVTNFDAAFCGRRGLLP